MYNVNASIMETQWRNRVCSHGWHINNDQQAKPSDKGGVKQNVLGGDELGIGLCRNSHHLR